MPEADEDQPVGQLALRIAAQPKDTNAAGDIFGGWIMGMMDMAAGATGFDIARGRIATVAVSDLAFLQPVKVGDLVSIYAEHVRTGRSSVTIDIDVWVRRGHPATHQRVTKARFVMVAVDKEGRPRQVSAEAAATSSAN